MTARPEKGLGRASDGRFVLSAIEIRNTTFSESQDPPLVYLSLAQADINQKPKEEPAPNDIPPGPLEAAIVIEPLGGGAAPESRSVWRLEHRRRRAQEAA